MLAAGCGTIPVTSGGGFAISSAAATVATTGQLRLSATMPDGASAAVNWSVSTAHNGTPLGAGSIDATGLYTPPNALSADSVPVEVTAHLQSDPSRTASETITVTPGFLQPLLPENAALSPGGTLEVSAQIAEVDAGTVRWSLSDGTMGTLSQPNCQHGKQQYTVCKMSYTAPSTFSGSQSVHITASVNDTNTRTTLHVLLNTAGVNSSALINQAAQNGLIALGASGSNDGDYDVYKDSAGNSYIADCCGGTLGALVEDTEHSQFILSNNHVLAESDQGRIGDSIDQPGLIDDACRPLSQEGSTVRPIGTLRYFVPLATNESNVDAALAAVTPGAINSDGSILQLGQTGGGIGASLNAAPPVSGNGETLNAENLDGLRVVKSGRTTGLTCSTVESVNLAVKVDYYKDCAETQPYYTKTFTGQIGIGGDSFSDSGDSGSLVLDAANAQPVGLFYAGGTDGNGNGLSIANPIGDVLTELGNQTGSKLSIVGSKTGHPITCLNYDKNAETAAALPELSQTADAQAKNAAQNAAAEIVNHEKGVLGVVAGKSADSPGEAAVAVYVDKTRPNTMVPQTIAGVRTAVILTDAQSIANGSAPKLPAYTAGIQLSSTALSNAAAIARAYAPQFLADPAIFGVGVTQSRDNPQEAALLVLVDLNKVAKAMPATVDGLRVRYMQLHRFHVTKSKYAGARPISSCALQSMKPVVLH
ncbi:hypothetical protein H7849_00270 [Alloacidobacterium dinghuense]|uniref:Uncharacterized protein n=1 Tax=Alloacidobacterium dinghuense TaxID=2763107 RepID=A0A7G8BIY5_9BACT|nr:hypothetical protein [Alloacidobacterium dinghuense]QNI32505.1 hypothetical protein H7849_00270 [Alloacidobacterium dinghuense]